MEIPRERFREEATEATPYFIIQDGKALLIEKKRGVGEGLFNGPGGKVEGEESPEEAAIREAVEETKVRPEEVEKISELEFVFGDDPFMFVHVFTDSSQELLKKPKRPEWLRTTIFHSMRCSPIIVTELQI